MDFVEEDHPVAIKAQYLLVDYRFNLLKIFMHTFLFTQKASQSAPRRNCFRRDIRLTHGHASLCTHYSRSGFDRGHMAPNGDFDTFDVNDETVMNSFLLSNIAPQHHWFNAGKSFRKTLINVGVSDSKVRTILTNSTTQKQLSFEWFRLEF